MADLIDRQAAIDAVHGMRLSDDQSDDEKGAFQLALTLAIGVLREVPSAQTMRPKGHWTSTGDIPDYCSECGNSWIDDYVDGWEGIWLSGITPNFCPNCGADMREEHDDSSQE